MGESFVDGSTARWADVRTLAGLAEELGFDSVWVPDELLWRSPDGETRGSWECVARTGAVAAATSRIKVGTRVPSALHRNPGITAKALETFEQISDGRFVLGLGSVHAGRQATGQAGLGSMARPEGFGRALATYEVPIEGRDEWLAAAGLGA